MMIKRIFALATAVLCFALDLLTKNWALAELQGQSIELTSFLNWSLAYNKGAAFSFLADMGGWQRYFFLAIAIAISLYLVYLIFREELDWLNAGCYGAVIGGALGNGYDRVIHGHVVDFIDVHWGLAHYPTFNVADIFICTAIGLLVIGSMVRKGHEKN